MPTSVYLGIDFGTSGARAIAINARAEILAQAQFAFASGEQQTAVWQTALMDLLEHIPLDLRQQMQAIAINGTSSTVLLCDEQGQPLVHPILYNDVRGASVIAQLQAIAPPYHTVLSATSSLAKLLWWSESMVNGKPSVSYAQSASESEMLGRAAHWQEMARQGSKIYFLHQADWLAFLLHGQLGVSDYHNALKLGYDVGELRYPDWMHQIPHAFQLPRVVAPGSVVGVVTRAIAQTFHLPPNCSICAGTTDSIAALLASGAQSPGEAVTSLGSTLVLKLLSQTRVDDVRCGIYSHRLGDLWLVGGASNTGGAVLQQFFTAAELTQLSQQINPDQPSPLDYYPLTQPGERFPINDPALPPRIEPRPDNPIEFLHGLLESIARIEARGYQLLQDLGATPLTQVYTAGGGAQNMAWTKMRSRHLGVPVLPSAHTEAAYGTARLALKHHHPGILTTSFKA